jgi:hypothetical protein
VRAARGASAGAGSGGPLNLPGLSSHITQDGGVRDQLDRVIGTLVKLVAK